MEKVNITIGSVAFDREGEDTPEGHHLRYAPGTYDIVGLTLLSPRRKLERDGHLTVTLPEQSKMSAEDLALAFAAV